MLEITVEYQDGIYSANFINRDDAFFCGKGNTVAEAIGQCFISNREDVDFVFDLTDKDGVKMYSTVYGKPRVKLNQDKILTNIKSIRGIVYRTSTDMTTEDLLKLYHALKSSEAIIASEMLSITFALMLHCL